MIFQFDPLISNLQTIVQSFSGISTDGQYFFNLTFNVVSFWVLLKRPCFLNVSVFSSLLMCLYCFPLSKRASIAFLICLDAADTNELCQFLEFRLSHFFFKFYNLHSIWFLRGEKLVVLTNEGGKSFISIFVFLLMLCAVPHMGWFLCVNCIYFACFCSSRVRVHQANELTLGSQINEVGDKHHGLQYDTHESQTNLFYIVEEFYRSSTWICMWESVTSTFCFDNILYSDGLRLRVYPFMNT